MIPPDNRCREEEFRSYSKSVQIGIFGYFSQLRISELERVRESLTKRGLNAKMSIDLHEVFVQRPDETDAGYSLRMSEELYNSSKIYIFILIPPPGWRQGCSTPSEWNTAGVIEIESHMSRRSSREEPIWQHSPGGHLTI